MKRISASFLPPIALDSSGPTPMYRQLYEWFLRAILAGQLRPGQRVPSTRNLAAELKISRIPVSIAYEQLRAEGYLETFVWGRHVRGPVNSSRRFQAGIRKIRGCRAAGFSEQSSSYGFAARGVDAHAGTKLVKQTGCLSSEPAGAGAFSSRSMVEADQSAFAKT